MAHTQTLTQMRYEHGFRLLGPIFAHYLARLEQHLHAFDQQHHAKILFAARAGVRIHRLLEVFTRARQTGMPPGTDFLWISRFMTVKGLWNRTPEAGARLLEKEFAWSTCGDIVAALYQAEGGLPADFPADDPLLRRPGTSFWEMMMQTDSPAARTVGAYLNSQSALFSDYISKLTEGRKSVVVVDSGWQGTTQLLLQRAYTDLEWWGVYWGRSFLPDADTSLAHKMIGLMFEADSFNPEKPISAVVLHRHLVEGILEPCGPSIERFAAASTGSYAPEAELLLQEQPDRETSPVFSGVLDYVTQLPCGRSYGAITRACQQAAPELARILAFPSKLDALAFGIFDRSTDFGRTMKVPVLVDNTGMPKNEAENRIEMALWKCAQIALEYPVELLEARQRQALGIKLTRQSLPEAAKSAAAKMRTPPRIELRVNRPTVAVIMRTMDRPILLDRAIRSVARQSFEDYLLVIVCDGGPIEPVQAAVERASIDKRKVLVVDNVVNRGMEAASNIAIASCDSEFLVIHDDDDSWEPDFLKKTVTFLRSPRGLKYGGVLTHCWYVSEQVTPEGIVIRDRRGYQDWVNNVQFMELCCGNFFPPIAFLYRRSVYQTIGTYDERLPVLGDWDFNLRFVMNSDIGVIQEKLAYYHHRDVGQTMYPNSVIGEIEKHAEFNAIMRNKYLRMGEMAQENSPGRALVPMAHVIADIRGTLRGMDGRFGQMHRPDSQLAAQANRAQATADNRWVELHYATAAGPEKKRTDDIIWRADCHWVQLHFTAQNSSAANSGANGTTQKPKLRGLWKESKAAST